MKMHNSNKNNNNNTLLFGDTNSNITRAIYFCFNSLLCVRQILRFQKALKSEKI